MLDTHYTLITALQTDLANKYKDLNDKYTTLRSDHETLKTNFNELKTDHETLKDNFNTLKSAHDTLQTNFNNLKASHETLENNFNNLKTSYDASKKLLDAIAGNLKSTGAMNGDGTMVHNIAYGNINIFGGAADGGSYIRTSSGSHENDITAGI